ncbi:MAG: IS110 family transposase [Bacteroidota bacterium]
MKNFIGIDISAKTFVVASLCSSSQKHQIQSFANTSAGIARFIAQLPQEAHCILEATGNYSLLLCYQLAEQGCTFSVINASESIHFRKLMGQIWKDDASDAKMLALYGEKLQPQPYALPTPKLIQLKQQRALLRQLKKQLQASKNFLHSLSVHPKKDLQTENITKDNIQYLSEQVEKIKKLIGQILAEEFEHLAALVQSVKGIGPQMTQGLIEATHGFTAFASPQQFSKFIGISPTYHQSGTSVRFRSQINRSGDPHLRAMLYVCAWSAIRYNSACKTLYERLLEKGKPSKVALVAVMNKLIRQVFAVVQKDQPYDDGFEEALKQKKLAGPPKKIANPPKQI